MCPDATDANVRNPQSHPKASLQPHDVPEGPWQVVGVDLVTGLPNCEGKDAVIVYSDLYSKQLHVLPTTTGVDAEGVADIHYREVFRLHGLPRKFVSNRGPQFAARIMLELYRKLGIESGLTTAYHPQSNGQTKRANQEVEKYLRLFVNKRQDNWVRYLPSAGFVLNSRVHSAHQMSPFEVVYGYRPDFTIPAGGPSNIPALDERLEHLREVRREAEATLQRSKERMKHDYKRDKHTAHTFKVGSKVWLNSKDIHVHQAS